MLAFYVHAASAVECCLLILSAFIRVNVSQQAYKKLLFFGGILQWHLGLFFRKEEGVLCFWAVENLTKELVDVCFSAVCFKSFGDCR